MAKFRNKQRENIWARPLKLSKRSRAEACLIAYLWTLVLNSSGVLDEITEEGGLFKTGIVLGKMNSSGHHYKQDV